MTMRRFQLVDETPAPPPAETEEARLRVAIASKDGKTLDSHFGSALRFAVHEVTPTSTRLVEVVAFESGSDEQGGHSQTEDRIGPRVAALAGCDLLFVLAIGGPAAAQVVAAKIHPIKAAAPEPIESILARIQTMMNGTPPPWLRKAMRGARPRPALDLDEETRS